MGFKGLKQRNTIRVPNLYSNVVGIPYIRLQARSGMRLETLTYRFEVEVTRCESCIDYNSLRSATQIKSCHYASPSYWYSTLQGVRRMLKDKSLLEDSNLVEQLEDKHAEVIEGGYRLRLNYLKCFDTTSGWGDDDTAIHINGRPVWGPISMGDDDGYDIKNKGGFLSFDFKNSILVEVWEHDSGSDHDLIGRSTIVGSVEQGKGVITRVYGGDGSHYQLWMEVT